GCLLPFGKLFGGQRGGFGAGVFCLGKWVGAPRNRGGRLSLKKIIGGQLGLQAPPPQAAAIAAPAQNISHHRRYAHSFVASTSLYRQHHCLPRGWRSASYTTSVRPSVAPAHASVPRDGGLHPLLCLDEPRIAQRCGLCRHAGGLSGFGPAPPANSLRPAAH